MKKNIYQILGKLLIILAFAFCGCAKQNLPESHHGNEALSATNTPTVEPTRISQQVISATVTPTLEPTHSSRLIIRPTDTPTVEPTHVSQKEMVFFEYKDESYPAKFAFPNLWTRINKADITIYPYDVISDYLSDKDGSLWIVGGFGVLHRTPNGEQTAYSIKNGLTRQFFTRVAISPKGEVWVGGTNNALFRFDGTQWIDEGEKLPLLFDNRHNNPYYSQTISGIDFDQNGSAWVMNNGIEIFTQVHGQWVYFPYAKELPIAGGGNSAVGIRAVSKDDITIMVEGYCDCSRYFGYHFNGKTWESDTSYGPVQTLIIKRHHSTLDNCYPELGDGRISSNTSACKDYFSIFQDNLLSRDFSPSQYNDSSITANCDGGVWITDGHYFYSNFSGKFEIVSKTPDYCKWKNRENRNKYTVKSNGEIWEYQNGDWRQSIIPDNEELFTHFVEDDNRVVYAATDTGVYRLEKETYSVTKFMEQNSRTLVESEETDCSFHRHYSTCFAWSGGYSPEDVYKAVTLGIQEDGSIIYVNNRLLAQLKDGKWKSFFFNTFEIDSAAIDKDGYLWLFSNSDGLFRLDPDVFDAYQETLD